MHNASIGSHVSQFHIDHFTSMLQFDNLYKLESIILQKYKVQNNAFCWPIVLLKTIKPQKCILMKTRNNSIQPLTEVHDIHLCIINTK